MRYKGGRRRVHLGGQTIGKIFPRFLCGCVICLNPLLYRLLQVIANEEFLTSMYLSIFGLVDELQRLPRQNLVFGALIRDGDAIFSRFFFAGTLAGNMENTCRSKFGPDTAWYAFYTLRNNGPQSVCERGKKSPSVTDLDVSPLYLNTIQLRKH